MTAGAAHAPQMYQALNDQALPGYYIQQNQSAAAREDLSLWDYGSAALTGLYHGAALSLPEQYTRVIRTVGRMVNSDDIEDWASNKLAEYAQLRQEDPYWRPDEKWMTSYTAKSLYEGFNSISTSLGLALPGIALAPMVPSAIAATTIGAGFFGAAFGGGTLAGLAEYDRFMDDAVRELGQLNPTMTREDIENEQFWNAVLSGFAEGGFEFAGDAIGGKLIGLFGKAGAEPARHILSKLFRNAGKSMLTEVPSELATAYAQDYIRESAGMDYQGRVQAMIDALGPSIVSAGAYGAAGTAARQFIPATEYKAQMDDMARRFKEDGLKDRYGEVGAQFVKDRLMVDLDENQAYAIAELIQNRANQWAQANGQDTSVYWADKMKQFTSLSDAGWSNVTSLAQALVTPDSSFDAVVGNTLQPMVQGMDMVHQDALVARYGTPDATGASLDHDRLSQDFMAWMKQPKSVEVDQQTEAAFTTMRDELVDSYGALKAAGAVKISPEAQTMFDKMFRRGGKKVVEAPGIFEITDTNALTAELEQIVSNSPESNEKIVNAFVKHSKYNFSPFTVGTDIKAIFAAFDKALEPSMKWMLDRQHDADMDAKAKREMETNGYSEAGIHSLFGDVVGNEQGSLSYRMRKAQIYESLAMKSMKNAAIDYKANPSPQAALALMTSQKVFGGIHAEMRGIRSEAGRFLRAVRMAGQDNHLDLRRMNELLEDHGGTLLLDKMSTIIMNAENDQQLRKVVEATAYDKTVNMLIEHVTLGMLTNPATQIVNVVGNGLTLVNEVWNRFVGSHLNPDQSDGLVRGETGAMLNGFWKALANIREAWSDHKQKQGGGLLKAAYNIDQMEWRGSGSSILDDGGMMERHLTRDNAQAVLGTMDPNIPGLSWAHAKASGGLSTVVEYYGRGLGLVSKSLLTADMFFKTVSYHMEVQARAYRRATQTAKATGGDVAALYKKYADAPLKQDKDAAMDFAKKITFQSDLGAIGRNINKIRQEAPLTRLMLPFLKTPINIIKYGAAHTPLVSKLFKEVRTELSSKDLATQQLAEARVMSGSLIWATALGLAAQGMLTGNGPMDPEERKRLQATGWQSNSLKLGDTYIGLDRLDPGAFILNTAASFYEIAQHLDDEDAEQASTAAIAAAIQTVSNRSYLQSVQSILDIIMNLDKPEGQRAVRDLITNAAVPASALMRTTARTIDPVAHETDTIINQLMSNIPGFSMAVPERRNFLGEVISAPDMYGPDHLSPIRTSKEKHDPVYDEFARLSKLQGISLPRMPQRVWRVGDKKARLDAELYAKYMGMSGVGHTINGKTLKQHLNGLVASRLYERATDEQKADMLRKAVSTYRDATKKHMIRTDPKVRYLLGM